MAAAASAPLWLGGYELGVLNLALVMGLLAISTNIVLGFGGLVTLGQGAFFGLGAYTAGLLSTYADVRGFAAVAIAVAVGTVAAGLVGLVVLRSQGLYFMMLTIAIAQLLYAVAFRWREVSGGPEGLVGVYFGQPGDLFDRPEWFYALTLVCLVVCTVIAWRLRHSPFGRSLIGTRENAGKMAALGFDVRGIQLRAFVAAGAIAALAGALFAYYNAFLDPSVFGIDMSALALIMVLLGGSGTIAGPIIGAVILTFLQSSLTSVSSAWLLILGIVYVLVVIVAPRGIVGLFTRGRS
ncbi:MAG: transporter permease [Naasia sp.]|nr:transporter permease [Naasia sp.]